MARIFKHYIKIRIEHNDFKGNYLGPVYVPVERIEYDEDGNLLSWALYTCDGIYIPQNLETLEKVLPSKYRELVNLALEENEERLRQSEPELWRFSNDVVPYEVKGASNE